MSGGLYIPERRTLLKKVRHFARLPVRARLAIRSNAEPGRFLKSGAVVKICQQSSVVIKKMLRATSDGRTPIGTTCAKKSTNVPSTPNFG
jgi:hypothetical protein